VNVVVFAVELAKLDLEVGADLPHDLFAADQHRAGESPPPVLGEEHQMGMKVIFDVSSGAHIGVRFPSR